MALLALALGGCVAEDRDAPPPSFVLFVVDDLGWADTRVYGSTFYDTPHVDRLAASGARFTRFYAAAPVCSPTRASLMTGKHPARLHLTDWIGGEQRGSLVPADSVQALPLQEWTLGEAFQRAGYRTGYIGKWHLGGTGYLPDSQGFDFMKAVNHAGQPGSHFFPYENPDWPVADVPDLDDGSEGEYLADRLTDEAIRFVRDNRERSFLLVLSHYAVHTPLEAPERLTRKYETRAAALPEAGTPPEIPEGPTARTKTRQDHPVFAGMVESVDASLGRLVAEIEALGLTSRTAILFLSDNGGLSTLVKGRGDIPTSNVPLRAGKGWLYEGGVRIPFIVRWPGLVEAGRVIDAPGDTTDVLPTMLAMAGLAPEPDRLLDGTSLWPLLRGENEPRERELFWHFPHYHGSGSTPSSAVLSGDLKLLEWLEDDRVELFDLARDPAESQDLVASRPDDADRLRERLRLWRQDVGALMPSPNPEADDAH